MKKLLGVPLTSTLASVLICSSIVACSSSTSETSVSGQMYQNSTLPAEVRAKDLVSKMTLKEKVGQMFDKAPAIDRLGVPEYNWWNEALHGVARAGTATVFPQAIGLASTFDPQLINKIGTAISDEGRAKHHAFLDAGIHSMYTGLTYWSPNINIFRDPRWGRGQETYGEDPYLTTQIAINFVNGLQGDNDKYLKSVATLKHYAVHSGPEVSRHSDDYLASPKDLTETYLAAFEDTIAETNVSSVMCAYNRVNGDPACASQPLIKDKLRGEFNFTGYIVSDCGAIADFYDPKSHGVVNSEAKAAALAVNAGTDLNCGDHHGNTFSYLEKAVAQGLIDEATIDQAVIRLFTARFKLGMFDDKSQVPYAQLPLSVVGSKPHTDLTLEAAEKSFVMLKNNGILPLKKDVKLALIGPNADNSAVLLGNYNGQPVAPVTPKLALEQYLGNNVNYAAGSTITGDVRTNFTPLPAELFFHKNYDGEVVPGIVAAFYPDAHFGNQPVSKKVVPNINFDWQQSPIGEKLEQEFAIKWHGLIKPMQTATYRFKTNNIAIKINGKDVHGDIKLEQGKQYSFTGESKLNQQWHTNVIEPSVSLSWTNLDIDLTKQALEVAKQSDVIVFVGGISANLEGEEMPLEIDGFAHGDRTHINLPSSQKSLLKHLKALNKPIIMVNFSGSAIALNWESQNMDAILQGFYPGEATGTALKNILFGDTSPSGKLPITFYQGVDDLPDFKNYKMANRTYKYYKGDVLYPFGYGLTYAADAVEFNIATHYINPTTGDIHLTTKVTNNSKVNTDDVVQVYLTMHDTPYASPIRQLVSFKRVTLDAKSQQTFELVIPKSKLMYVDQDGQKHPHLGEITLTVGNGQAISGFSTKTNAISLELSL